MVHTAGALLASTAPLATELYRTVTSAAGWVVAGLAAYRLLRVRTDASLVYLLLGGVFLTLAGALPDPPALARSQLDSGFGPVATWAAITVTLGLGAAMVVAAWPGLRRDGRNPPACRGRGSVGSGAGWWPPASSLAGLTVTGRGAALAGPAAGSRVPAPTPGRLLLAWSFNPLVTVGLLAAAGLPPGQAPPGGRRGGLAGPVTGCFLAGIGVLAVACCRRSRPTTRCCSRSTSSSMLLTMLAAPLLALGAPITPAAPRVARVSGGMVRVLYSPPLRVIGHLLVAWVLFTFTLYALYFSPLFDFHRAPLVHDAVYLHFLAVGLLFWWPLSASTCPAGACPTSRLRAAVRVHDGPVPRLPRSRS